MKIVESEVKRKCIYVCIEMEYMAFQGLQAISWRSSIVLA